MTRHFIVLCRTNHDINTHLYFIDLSRDVATLIINIRVVICPNFSVRNETVKAEQTKLEDEDEDVLIRSETCCRYIHTNDVEETKRKGTWTVPVCLQLLRLLLKKEHFEVLGEFENILVK
ncbi:uncharacterized protein LOC134709166 isoform X2 [Mytilus trossulus]|uniref:uncharacterized protein LOC134709166 isoform X2 n=1 Tax=Mytilus trossulus TaxID=6551 RepID=UPI003005C998